MEAKNKDKAVLTPDGRPLRHGMCTCSSHCASGPHHERACCAEVWCDCSCHADEYAGRGEKATVGEGHPSSQTADKHPDSAKSVAAGCCSVPDAELKLRAFCEGLEIQNVDRLLEQAEVGDFRRLGERMAERTCGMKRLLYKAYYRFGHREMECCPTWYDGCNCLIPFDDFDNEYWAEIVKEMRRNEE